MLINVLAERAVDNGQASYFSNFGPVDGPIRQGDCPSAIGVSLDPAMPWQPDGIAYGVSYLAHWRGPVATFRLVVGKTEISGRWVCIGRRFVSAEEWAEQEAIRNEAVEKRRPRW